MDIEAIRAQFPITQQRIPVLGHDEPQPLIYLDHGASTHAPRVVLDAHYTFLERYYANIHRATHHLSMIASELFDDVTQTIAEFIGADMRRNVVVLTGNTTSALDLASHVMGHVPGMTLVTLMEHHSNDLPHRRRGEVRHVEVTREGFLDMEDLARQLQANKVKLVAVTGASNVTGIINDVHRVAELAHAHGARVLVDAAQSFAHIPIDVRPDDDPGHLDFLAAAGHKSYAPLGSAFLFGPRELMDAAEAYTPGGGTVLHTTEDQVVWNPSPGRHQGGTPNIAGAVGFAVAMRFLAGIGMDAVREHERVLTDYGLRELAAIEGVQLIGPPDGRDKVGVMAFNIAGLSHALVSSILNFEHGIATRNGRFCAHSYIHRLLGVGDPAALLEQKSGCGAVEIPGAVRATLGIYNTDAEVARLVAAVRQIARREWVGDYVVEPGVPCVPRQLLNAVPRRAEVLLAP